MSNNQDAEFQDSSYTTTGEEPIPVVKDDKDLEQQLDGTDPDSDKALQQDENEAIDKSNILKGDRTRHTGPEGGYKDPEEDEELPKSVVDGTDGTSSSA